jgi:hypothetical protein
MGDFRECFYRGLKELDKGMYSSGKYAVMDRVLEKYVKNNDNVAVLAVGNMVEDIYYLRKYTQGKLFFVDGDPSYPFDLIARAGCPVPGTLEEINALFSEINAECFVQKIPPLPEKNPGAFA